MKILTKGRSLSRVYLPALHVDLESLSLTVQCYLATCWNDGDVTPFTQAGTKK
jgi:hypothetical protein